MPPPEPAVPPSSFDEERPVEGPVERHPEYEEEPEAAAVPAPAASSAARSPSPPVPDAETIRLVMDCMVQGGYQIVGPYGVPVSLCFFNGSTLVKTILIATDLLLGRTWICSSWPQQGEGTTRPSS